MGLWVVAYWRLWMVVLFCLGVGDVKQDSDPDLQ
jgi:hypothetical protein